MNYQKNLFEPVYSDNYQAGQQSSNRTFSFNNTESSALQNTLGNTYNERADLMSYLEKDFNVSAKIEDSNYKADMLRNEIKHLQNVLPAFGYPVLGDPFSGNLVDVESTVRCVSALLQQRQKDIEFRQEVYEKIQKVENEKMNTNQAYERVILQKKNLEIEIEKLINKNKLHEKTIKEEREKFVAERDELNKLIIKLQGRDIQYAHEIRNRDNTYKKLQDQLKKFTDKNTTFKNNFEITSTLENKGPILFSGNSESEFTKMISNSYEDIRNRLVAENDLLREALTSIQKELFEILEQKKELFFKRRRIELGDDNKEEFDFAQTNLLNLKKELFEMPTQTVGKDAVECLQENLRRFREYMTKIDVANKDLDVEYNFDTPAEFEKIKCVKNMKNLLKNYKYIVETQDGLINKAIIKQNNIKDPEHFGPGSRFKVMDDKELDKVKQFLQDQRKYLEEKNNEIEIAKNTINATTKKFDEEKMLISQKRHEIEEETEKYRQNIQDIMSKNKAFINSIVTDRENIPPNPMEEDFSNSMR